MAKMSILEAVKPKEDEPKPAKSMDKILQDLVNEMFSFYFKVHKYHWNVVGINFFDLHKMFGNMYEDVWEDIDTTAEFIRALGVMADIKPVMPPSNATGDMQMVADVLKANQSLIDLLKTAEEAADYYENCDIENFIADRLKKHNKWNWQLSAFKGGK